MMWRCVRARGSVPEARSSHVLCAVNNTLYVYGGEQEPRVPLPSRLYSIKLRTDAEESEKENLEEWSVSDVKQPQSLIAATGAAIGTNLYVFGGRAGLMMGDGDNNEIHCLDTVTGNWRQIPTEGDIPPSRSYHAMTAAGEKLYIFGGCSAAGRLNDLWAFDTRTEKWEKQPSYDVLSPRGGAGLVTVKQSLFVVGGFNGEEETNDMYEYNCEKKTWRTVKAQPNIPARSVFALSRVGSRIVLFGGEEHPSDAGHAGAGRFSNDVFVFDVDADVDAWNRVEVEGDIPEPRGWLVATEAQNKVYIFGGNLNSNERANDLYALTL